MHANGYPYFCAYACAVEPACPYMVPLKQSICFLQPLLIVLPAACRFTVCAFYNDTDILAQTGGKVNMRICAEAAD